MLYYGVGVDPTMLVALGSISYYRPKVTYNTCYDTKWLMYYNYSNFDAQICYHTGDILLHIHADASYLPQSKACSCSGGGGGVVLSRKIFDPTKPQLINTRLMELSTPLRNINVVVGSYMEAKICGVYLNAQEALLMKISPEETLIHTQTHVDKTTSVRFFDYTTKNNNPKQIDMH